jgi:hypothetical protein
MNCFIISPTLKCGSTLLEWMLNQHPTIAANPIRESYGIGEMLNVMDWLPENQHLVESPKIVRHGFVDATRKWYGEIINPNKLDFSGARFTGFTSCRFLRWMFPDDPMLIIVRDPVDTWLSYKRWHAMHGARDRGVPSVSAWFSGTYARLNQSLGSVSNTLVVNFEDLITDHQRVIDSCCDHLGIGRFSVDLAGNGAVYANMTAFPGDSHDGDGLMVGTLDRTRHAGPSEVLEIMEIRRLVRTADTGGGILARYQGKD